MESKSKYVQQVDENTIFYYPMDRTEIPLREHWQDGTRAMKDRAGNLDLNINPMNSQRTAIGHPSGDGRTVLFYSQAWPSAVYLSARGSEYFPVGAEMPFQQPYTISFWIYDLGRTSTYEIGLMEVTGRDSSGNSEEYNTQFSLHRINNSGNLVLRTQYGNSITGRKVTLGEIPFREWCHVVITKVPYGTEPKYADFKVYINGVLDEADLSLMNPTGGDFDSNARMFSIGRASWRNVTSDTFGGSIINWQMDSVVRDQNWVTKASQTYEPQIDEHTIHFYDGTYEPDVRDHGPNNIHLFKEGNGFPIEVRQYLNLPMLTKGGSNFLISGPGDLMMNSVAGGASFYPVSLREVLTGSWTLEMVARFTETTNEKQTGMNMTLFQYGATSPFVSPSTENNNTLFNLQLVSGSFMITHHSGSSGVGEAGRLSKVMHTLPDGSAGNYYYVGITKELIENDVSCSYKMYLNGEFIDDFECANCTAGSTPSTSTNVGMNFISARYDRNQNGALADVKLSTDVKPPEHFKRIANLYQAKRNLWFEGRSDTGEIVYSLNAPPKNVSSYRIAGSQVKETTASLSKGELEEIEIYDLKEQLPGMLAWWKTDEGLLVDSGDFVTKWEDQSGNGLHLDTTYSSPPYILESDADFSGHTSVVFGGTQDISRPYDPYDTRLQEFPNGMTCFVVAKTLGGWTTYSTIMGTSDTTSWNNGWCFGSRDGTGSPNMSFWMDGWTRYAQSSFPTEVPFVGTGAKRGSTIQCRVNSRYLDVYTGTTPTTTIPSTTYFSIGRSGASGYYGQFKIAEIIIYNREFTRGEINSVEKYLRDKYGI